MKKLITAKVIEELIKNNQKQIVVDDDTLLTPSAKDLARNAGIKFVYEAEADCVCNSSCCDSNDTELTRETVVRAVLAVLNEKGLLK